MNTSSGIKGITKSALWKAWKSVRQELKRISHRDVIDYLEYDLNPDVWIRRLLKQISDGRYEPTTPMRYSLAKSNGFSRLMTRPHIPDAVLYRAIVDHLYRKARRFRFKHTYFLRDTLGKAQRDAEVEGKQEINFDVRYSKINISSP